MFKIKKKIGIFGGSFDPPHSGHYKISSSAIRKLKLNKLLWTVTKKNPFKSNVYFSLQKRISKSKLISKKNKRIKVVYLDTLAKSSNIISLLKYLIKKNKNCEFFLIIGSDNLIKLHKWKKWREIVKLSKLVVFSRKGFDKIAQKSIVAKKLPKSSIIYIKDSKIDISSSQLRKNYLK
tara:strand:+ start:518 stop:1051 length:534 start_codon:yes stop_codon:yes gene_type:complete